jgi:ABC-type sugar transport system ATPase subunit
LTEPERKSTLPYLGDRGFKGKIDLRNVSYRYGSSERDVLRNCNLSIEPGKIVAIVGPSGTGKSTLFKILAGQFEARSGDILIDDVPLSVIGLSHYRSLIGVVPQDDMLFEGTIGENIAFLDIADFRRVNWSAFKQVFWEFVILCRQLDLFGRELLAVDGTRIKAVNNKDRNFTRGALIKFIREADEKLSDYMKRLDEGDAEEEASGNGSGSSRGDGKLAEKIAAIKGKRDRHKALLDELDSTGEDQISLTGPDARAMARMTKVGVGYNIQLVVDVKHKLIAEQEVSNQVLDMGLLAPTVEAAMGTLGVEKIEAVADRGYFKIEDIEACEKAGITAFVPKPIRGPAVAQGFFSKEEFRYDAEADVYICPADHCCDRANTANPARS